MSKKYNKKYIVSKIENNCLDLILLNNPSFNIEEVEINNFFNYFNIKHLSINIKYPEHISIKEDDIISYFKNFDLAFEKIMATPNIVFNNSNSIIREIRKLINESYKALKENLIYIVNYDYSCLFEDLTKEEKYLYDNISLRLTSKVSMDNMKKLQSYIPYEKIENDKESAIIGVDLMKQIKINDEQIQWIESKSVSSKIANNNKFNSFISNKYSKELESAKLQYFNGYNNFKLNSDCNSIIGFCVEYYSKYLVYGEEYLKIFIEKAKKEFKTKEEKKFIIIRACILKYKDMMTKSFGVGVAKKIKTISVEKLSQKEYEYFINLVIELGTKTAEYVKKELYKNNEPQNNIDPNLSITHITGLADYITKDTILDIKVKNNIDEKAIRQVLAYHYLSTKRSDLNVTRVIVYDAVSNKSITINIDSKNIKNNEI